MKKSTLAKSALVLATLGVAALCPLAGIIAGTWIGVAAATTTGGAVGLGIVGFLAGGIAGRIAKAIVSAPAKVYLAAKAGAALQNDAPSWFGNDLSDFNKGFGTLALKFVFEAANKGAPKKVVTTVPTKKPFFNLGGK